MLRFSSTTPFDSNIHFLHNWRCAGTSVNSLLSSNFHSAYFKIGHPFTHYGWPESYKNHREPFLTIGQLRDSKQTIKNSNIIVGGHTYLGLETSLPGPWQTWMNYRDPVQRLNSGILRFYSKRFKFEKGHLLDQSKMRKGEPDLEDPSFIDDLLNSSLFRESNGMAKRIAGMSICPEYSLSTDTNIETHPLLTSYRYPDKILYEACLENIKSISAFISIQYLHESILSIERLYSLTSPLINPFSDLRHNPVEMGGAKPNDSRIIDNALDVLRSHTNVDRQLIPILNSRLMHQINNASIDQADVQVRKIIHRKALFSPKWFDQHGNPRDERVLLRIAGAIILRCQKAGELGDRVFSTLISWRNFSDSTVDQIKKIKRDTLGSSSF